MKVPLTESAGPIGLLLRRRARRILKILLACNLVLVCLHLLFREILAYPTFRAWFDLDGEMNVPTWFSSAQLLLCCVLSLFRAYASRRRPDNLTRAWLIVAAAFGYLSMDETAVIHERLGAAAREVWPGIHGLPWGNSFALYIAAGLAVLYAFRKEARAFLFAVPLRSGFYAGAAVWLLGAAALELGGLYFKLHAMENSLWLRTEVVLEESMELIGESLFIFALAGQKLRGLRPDLSRSGCEAEKRQKGWGRLSLPHPRPGGAAS